MQEPRPMSAVEQRRKLLKGALAASGVVTMGYSGAALASFECVEDNYRAGGFPIGDSQFAIGSAPPSTNNGKEWAWQQVQVWQYKDGSTYYDGFTVNGNIYDAAHPTTLIPIGAQKRPDSQQQAGGYPKTAWVLAYFDFGGGTNGVFPSPQSTAGDNRAPATQSCLASVNPGLDRSGFTFGG